MNDIVGCVACDLSQGRRELPGGLIHHTRYWRVEHCVGPLGVGTLIVKPTRHVERLADLTSEETAEIGPLLRTTATIVGDLAKASQVYACLWSHGPTHIHFVVQPETAASLGRFGEWGPALQARMFAGGEEPDPRLVLQFADSARADFERALLR